MSMKNFRLLIIILIPSLIWGVSKEGEDLQTLDNLVSSTERQLTLYKELRDLVANFQKQQDVFHEGEQTKELAIQMVLTASKILKTAEEHKLLYLFTPFYVEELKLFSGISKKKAQNEVHPLH